MSAFASASAIEPLGDGAWGATCDSAWSTEAGVNGGFLAAVILRAMMAAVDEDGRQPRSLTCHYLRPPAEGDVRVDVAVERSGRSLSTLSAQLTQDGRLCVAALAAFAIDLDGALDYAGTPPATPRPDERQRMAPVATVPITAQFEMRPTFGAPLFAGADEALSGGWLRFADSHPLDAPALAMYADAWWPSPLPRLTRPASAPTVDLTVHFRAPAAAAAVGPEEPVLVIFRSSTSAHGFFEEDGELWSRDGVLLAQSRQLALLLGEAR